MKRENVILLTVSMGGFAVGIADLVLFIKISEWFLAGASVFGIALFLLGIASAVRRPLR